MFGPCGRSRRGDALPNLTAIGGRDGRSPMGPGASGVRDRAVSTTTCGSTTCGSTMVSALVSGERENWTSEVRKSWPESNVLPVLGIVLLVLPAYFTGRWIRIFRAVGDHDDRVAEFGSILPRVLQDPLASTLFVLACAAAAAAVGAVGLIRLTGVRRGLCVATLAGGWLWSLWFVWTLL